MAGGAGPGPEGDVRASGSVEVGAEVEIDETLLDAIEQDLADVERALALLDDGTYGQCEACGNAIDDDDLARVPATRFCRDHLPLTLP